MVRVGEVINAESIYTAERGEAITRLDRLCRLLPYISMFIISITLIHVVLLLGQFVYIIGFGGIIFHNIYGIERFEKLVPILLTSPSLTFFLILLAFRFEYLKREGDAYFEELSDELHGVRTNNDHEINFSSKSVENF